jgi:hypothetical protein
MALREVRVWDNRAHWPGCHLLPGHEACRPAPAQPPRREEPDELAVRAGAHA